VKSLSMLAARYAMLATKRRSKHLAILGAETSRCHLQEALVRCSKAIAALHRSPCVCSW
jgi:hypothetical protein